MVAKSKPNIIFIEQGVKPEMIETGKTDEKKGALPR
ncbi:MAG: hypothetical protein ACI92G_003698 [Candidatus Pelagisphaera sp.]|jgi:hypothetical protein